MACADTSSQSGFRSEIAQHLAALIRRREMEIGGLPPHGFEDLALVPVLRELRQFDAAAMRSQPAHHPFFAERIIGIALTDCAADQSRRVGTLLDLPHRPAPRRREPRLRLTRGQTPAASADRDVARAAEAAHSGDARDEPDVGGALGKLALEQSLDANLAGWRPEA